MRLVKGIFRKPKGCVDIKGSYALTLIYRFISFPFTILPEAGLVLFVYKIFSANQTVAIINYALIAVSFVCSVILTVLSVDYDKETANITFDDYDSMIFIIGTIVYVVCAIAFPLANSAIVG